MTEENGGGSRSHEKLAPVIPLFGRSGAGTRGASTTPSSPPSPSSETVTPLRDPEGAKTRTGARHLPASGGTASGGAASSGTTSGGTGSDGASLRAHLDSGTPSERHPARGGAASNRTPPRLRALNDDADATEGHDVPDPDRVQEIASESLVRKLRARSLSVSEARMVLRGHQLESGRIDDVIDEFLRRGYLDDAMLAGQLVESGAQRKGQGRVALSRALAQRGIPRDVIDAALGELPNDDAERALEFARSKARSLSRLDPDTALRRLMGQLARRGYGGSVAMTAAKTALAEETFGGPPSGVRFVDSD